LGCGSLGLWLSQQEPSALLTQAAFSFGLMVPGQEVSQFFVPPDRQTKDYPTKDYLTNDYLTWILLLSCLEFPLCLW